MSKNNNKANTSKSTKTKPNTKANSRVKVMAMDTFYYRLNAGIHAREPQTMVKLDFSFPLITTKSATLGDFYNFGHTDSLAYGTATTFQLYAALTPATWSRMLTELAAYYPLYREFLIVDVKLHFQQQQSAAMFVCENQPLYIKVDYDRGYTAQELTTIKPMLLHLGSNYNYELQLPKDGDGFISSTNTTSLYQYYKFTDNYFTQRFQKILISSFWETAPLINLGGVGSSFSFNPWMITGTMKISLKGRPDPSN